MTKMIWLYQCEVCNAELATESAFTRDEGPPAKAIECVACEKTTMRPVRQMSTWDLTLWAAGRGSVGGHEDCS